MFDIPFVRLAMPCVILYLFHWMLIVNPYVEREEVAGYLSPETAQELRLKGIELMEAKRFREALKPIETLHKAFPDNHIYMNDLANAYHGLGRFGEEAAMWELFIQHAPVPVDGCPQIGKAYASLGQKEQTLKSMRRCFEFEPSNSDMIFFYAHELEMNGESAKAKELYEKGRLRAPEYPDISIGLARTQSATGDNRAAKKSIDEVLASRPNNSDALFAAGVIASRRGDLTQARKYLERLKSLQPDYAEVDTFLASLNFKLRSRVAGR